MMLVFFKIWFEAYQCLLSFYWLQTFEPFDGSTSNGLPPRTFHVNLAR